MTTHTVPRVGAVAPVAVVAAGVTLWFARADWTTWPALSLFALVGVALAAIDLDRHLLPRRIVYPTLAITALLVTGQIAAAGHWDRLLSAAGGAVATAGFFYVIALTTQGLGLGDVRLGLLTGLIAGWSGPRQILLALLLTTVLGVLLGLIAARRAPGARQRVPYGPAMIAGTLLAVWVQPPI